MDLQALTSGRVVLVGPDGATSVIQAMLEHENWECSRHEAPPGVLRRLRAESSTDLVILASEPFAGSSGDAFTELCRNIKFDARTAFIAVVFVLPGAHATYCSAVYEARADDCIILPAAPGEILLRLSNALRVKRATDVLEDSAIVLTSLAEAIEGRDAYTHGHVERVAAYAMEMGKRVGVDSNDLQTLKYGGIVHDIGKVAIPDAILNKRGRLDDVEMELIRRHPLIGYDILRQSRTFHDVLPIVRWHHERPNGKGYPDGLAGDALPLLPRIVAVADVFDAISTARPYRTAMSLLKCRDILRTSGEDGDLDLSLVEVLLGILAETDLSVAESLVGAVGASLVAR